ncbi:MAG: adenosylcobinamide-GDP ribazoletransferase [Eubacteriales bacterium]|nr:adenosylcobinamide-GDP ribazoletransferase [Eubacteriales bacterium]
MKFVTGFFMAWGNFLSLPCPLKRWDSNLKNIMLAFLPSVGLVIGLLWMLLYWLADYFKIPETMAALILMVFIYGICGFMHLDGFMDCNDAIMSRRPLEERQRILKDSHTGAFAVITLVLLFIGFYVSIYTALEGLDIMNLLIIPVISRGVSAICVLSYKPIGHSQYVKDYEEKGRAKYRIAVIFQVVTVVCAGLYFSLRWIDTLACSLLMIIVGFLVCGYARKQLGGMSGDIAGYTISITELAGILMLAII